MSVERIRRELKTLAERIRWELTVGPSVRLRNRRFAEIRRHVEFVGEWRRLLVVYRLTGEVEFDGWARTHTQRGRTWFETIQPVNWWSSDTRGQYHIWVDGHYVRSDE